MSHKISKSDTMEELVSQAGDELIPFSAGQIVNAKVLLVNKHSVMVDVAGVALGMVPEKEFSYDTGDLLPEDVVSAYVLVTENQDGYAILSLKRADRERVWITLAQKQKDQEPIKVKVASVNRGGAVVDFGGIEGFIPTSQLNIRDSKDSLRDLIGQTILVKVIAADKTTNKLIFSKKAVGDEKLINLAKNIKIGSKLVGKITGIVDYGLFTRVAIPDSEEEIEGLVHISEVSWDRTENLGQNFKIGQKIDVEVIDNKGGRLSLSIKRLSPNPWEEIDKKLKPEDRVVGEVSRVTPFGAFVKLPGNIDGLVHISELGENIDDPKKVVTEGEKYTFRILSIEKKSHKISLSLKEKKPVKDKVDKTKKSSNSLGDKKISTKIKKPTAKAKK